MGPGCGERCDREAASAAALAQATTISLDSDDHFMLSRPAGQALILAGIVPRTALAHPAMPVLVPVADRVGAGNASMKRTGAELQGRAGSCEGRVDEGEGELLKVTAGSVGKFAQGPLPGEHGKPVHRGPDGVLDARATLPAERAGVSQFV